MDVNQEIVKEYLQRCKKFVVVEEHPFQTRGKGQRRGKYWSEIDLLAIDPRNSRKPVWVIEVKWRRRWKFDKSGIGITEMANQILDKDKQKAVRKLIGNRSYRNVLVINEEPFGKKHRDRWERYLKSRGIQIEYSNKMLEELVREIESSGKYLTPVSQTISLLKYYKRIK